jgi:homogentisate 1,2-dioxygenase
MSSLLYHVNRPTQVKHVGEAQDVTPQIAEGKNLKSRLLKGFDIPSTEDYLNSRIPVLVNNDCQISLAAPKKIS